MMKSLLVLLASLTMLSANAQLRKSDAVAPRLPQPMMKSVKPQAQVQEMQLLAPGTLVLNTAPEKDGDVRVWYRRPAGAYPASVIVEDECNSGFLYAPYLHVKPYQDYTFLGFAEGVSDQAVFEWDVTHWDWYGGNDQRVITTVPGQDLTWQWGYETDEVPTLYVIEPDATYEWWYPGTVKTNTLPGEPNPSVEPELKSEILSVPSTMAIWDMDILMSSKTFLQGSNEGEYLYPMTYFSGAEPYGGNSKGWWFGKNGYHQVVRPNYFIDGIAQAFEKPSAPYLLNQVVVDCGVLEVLDRVDLMCRIYKLDEIPAYNDTAVVTLPEEPGELIAKGRATLTPETNDATGGLVFFTLFGEEDGLEYDITPTIDCAILIVIDGYNDPEMANLQDFSAMIAANDQDDEGFGELAYLKFGTPDDNGGVNYVWTGLNNFFRSGTMKTGFTIFINAEMPYLTFNYAAEDGEYTFPAEGGPMEKPIGDDYTSYGIEFWSWTPSVDDGWWLYCNGGDVPDWLSIELTDVEQYGEWSGLVIAEVYAEPLPAGVNYREAVVRFMIPGAYLDYKFMQGRYIDPPRPHFPDINGDGEVNIADLNYLIYLILTDQAGDANIADVNMLIQIILSKNQPF